MNGDNSQKTKKREILLKQNYCRNKTTQRNNMIFYNERI